MVYCSKCGTLNSNDATICSKCGASLSISRETASDWQREHYREREYRHHSRSGSGIGALIAGTIIILIGLGVLFPEVSRAIPWWYVLMIIIGVWLLFVGIRQSRRHSQTSQ